MKIILISGKARSGKDTFATALQKGLEEKNQRVLCIHYADFLKFFCQRYLGWDGNKDDYGRELLQRVGTDVFRKNYSNAWVDIMTAFLRGAKSEYDFVIIPDTRFVNEIEDLRFNNWVCKEHGTEEFAERIETFRIERPNFDNGLTLEQQMHPSETSLDTYTFDHYYANAGDLTTLENDVKGWVDEILEW